MTGINRYKVSPLDCNANNFFLPHIFFKFLRPSQNKLTLMQQVLDLNATNFILSFITSIFRKSDIKKKRYHLSLLEKSQLDFIKKVGHDLTFPNFRKIKTDWKELLTQIQDLEGISTRIKHEEQIKQVNNHIAINKGLQAQDIQDWNIKWTEIRKQMEDNKRRITPTTPTTRAPDTGRIEEEEEEDSKVVGYLKKFLHDLKTKKQNYDEFCDQWHLDCRIIAWTSMIMIAIGIITMIVAIKLAFTTYDLNKRVHRLYEYMDLQATRKEQEEDDSSWKTRISNPNDTFNDFTPNPTRNKFQMKKNYTNLNNKINQTQQVLLTNGFNITDIKINQPGGQREPGRDQDQGATSPLLGQ